MDRFPEGFTALVQGASRGIGLAFVRQLLADSRCGHVIATARSPQRGALVELQADWPDRLSCVSLDVADDQSIDSAAVNVRESHGRLHLLINVSGVLHDEEGLFPEKRVEDIRRASLDKSFAVNAFGPALVCGGFFQLLQHDEHAVIANLSARVGSIEDNRLGGWYAYRASKAAQNQFTRTLSVEASRRAKRLVVIALHPGTTDTGLSVPFQKNVPKGKLFDRDRSARQLLDIIGQVGRQDNGRFFAWDGAEIPW